MRVASVLLALAAFASTVASQSNLFWHNEVTGASSDERPECLPYPDQKTKRSYWIVDGVASWVAPTEYSWRAINTTEKPPRTFYENYKTNETQWEKPASLGWSHFRLYLYVLCLKLHLLTFVSGHSLALERRKRVVALDRAQHVVHAHLRVAILPAGVIAEISPPPLARRHHHRLIHHLPLLLSRLRGRIRPTLVRCVITI